MKLATFTLLNKDWKHFISKSFSWSVLPSFERMNELQSLEMLNFIANFETLDEITLPLISTRYRNDLI